MKKVVILLMILLVPNVFAQNLTNVIKNRLIQIEENAYQKNWSDKQKYCKDVENFYTKLLSYVKNYEKKYPRYMQLLELIYQVAADRFKENKKLCLVSVKYQTQSKVSLRWDFYLYSLVDKNEVLKYKKLNDNRYLNPQISLQSFVLNKINKANEIYKNYVKIDSKWYLINGYSYIEVSEEWDLNNILSNVDYYLDKVNANYLIYGLDAGKYKVFLVAKDHIKNLFYFNPKNSLYKNASLVNKLGWLYIWKIFYANVQKWIVLWWLMRLWNNLFFFVPRKKLISYISLNKNFDLFYAVFEKKYPILLNYSWNIYAFPKDIFNFYYIWPYRLYEKINLQKLGYILFPSFYRLSSGNYPYNTSYMYDLLLTATKFDNKRLSDVWDWIINNFKYENKISDLINSKWFNQQKLNEYLKQHPSLVKNWIDFYTLKEKKWVCQTLSDIFSFIALLNWLDATVVDWYVPSRGYSHQVSKIWDYYYDPTYGLANNDKSYFWMTKQYFKMYFSD